MLSSKKSERAYLAALIDGEGWLGTDRRMRARLEITNRSADLAMWLVSKFGGSFHLKFKKAGHPYFRWVLGGKKLLELLDKILKYLIIKKDRAAEMLERGISYGTE